jgi:triacylglycerol lipase
MKRLKGIARLIFDAVEETTRLVEETHESVVKKHVGVLAAAPELEAPVRAVDDVRRAVTRGVYESILLVNRGVGSLAEAGFALAEPLVPAKTEDERATPLRSDAVGSSSWWIEAAEGVLNGTIGNYLELRKNPLSINMSFYYEGRLLPLDREGLERLGAERTRKLSVFVHGLSCTEWSWSIFAEQYHGDPEVNFGTLLRDDLGYTPIYVRYNTGRHVSENGEDLAKLLTELVASCPGPVDEIVLIGHSMGGLVARSAAHYAASSRAAWIDRLKHVFCIGSPHFGAPLEQGVNVLASILAAFDTPGTQIPAKILNLRSSGIKDLRFGYCLHEEWRDHEPDAFLADKRQDLALVDGVGYYFIASTIFRDPEHPLADLVGDLLVRPPSASGRHRQPERCIPFKIGKVFHGMHHLHLGNHPDVYAQIRQWCAGTTSKP